MKKIIFIIILIMLCNVSLHSTPNENWIDYSDEGAFSWGLFEGIFAYSDTSKIGIDTVPFWKAYIKNGYIDSLYAIEYIDSVYKIHKIEGIDTLFKVFIDSLKLDSLNLDKFVVDTLTSDGDTIFVLKILKVSSIITDSIKADSIETKKLIVTDSLKVGSTTKITDKTIATDTTKCSQVLITDELAV